MSVNTAVVAYCRAPRPSARFVFIGFKRIFVSKKFLFQNMLIKKNIGSKNILSRKFFGSIKFLIKKFWLKKCCVQEIWVHKTFGSKEFLYLTCSPLICPTPNWFDLFQIDLTCIDWDWPVMSWPGQTLLDLFQMTCPEVTNLTYNCLIILSFNYLIA